MFTRGASQNPFIPQTRGGNFSDPYIPPPAQVTPAVSAPKPAQPQNALATVINPSKSFMPAASSAERAQAAANNFTSSLGAASATPQAKPAAQQPSPMPTQAAKPKYDINAIIGQAFQYAPRASNPSVTRGGGVSDTLKGGYNAGQLMSGAYSSPDAFMNEAKRYFTAQDQGRSGAIDSQGFRLLEHGMTPGYQMIFNSIPDYLRQQITSYNRESDKPEVPVSPPAAQFPGQPPQQDLVSNINLPNNQVVPDYVREEQAYDPYREIFDRQNEQYNQLLDLLASATQVTATPQQVPTTYQQAVEPPPLNLKRPYEMATPRGLEGFLGGLSDLQMRTALATRGTQGEGLDQEGSDYFLNSLQRLLIDDNNTLLDGRFADLTPIEKQYIESMGLPASSAEEFLRAVARR